jgi:hypothetical protein
MFLMWTAYGGSVTFRVTDNDETVFGSVKLSVGVDGNLARSVTTQGLNSVRNANLSLWVYTASHMLRALSIHLSLLFSRHLKDTSTV